MNYRPVDWSPLGLSSDPIPGDPLIVGRAGNDYIDIAEAIRDAELKLRKLDKLGDIAKASDALRDKAGGVADNIAKAHDRYRATGQALRDYAPKLAQAQDDSEDALAQARAAQADAESAANEKKHYLGLADDADDPREALKYKNLAEDDSASSAASSKLSAAKEKVRSAMENRDHAADAAVDQIKDITDHDGLKDSWWDNWGKDLVKIITEIAGWVAAIAGVLALLVCWIPVVGQALAGVLLVVAGVGALINALGSVVLATTGEMTWTEAIIAVVGTVLACVGLGAAGKMLSGAFRAGRAAVSTERAANGAAKLNKLAALQDAGGYDIDVITAQQVAKMSRSEFRESLKAYRSAIPDPHDGQALYRVSPVGRENGGSWSPVDPRAYKHPSSTLGLPPDNSMNTLTIATLKNPNVDDIIVRHALPYGGNPGGGAEYYFTRGGTLSDKGLEIIEQLTFTVPR